METIFDHQPTPAELKYLFSDPDYSRAEYVSNFLGSEAPAIHLFKLYRFRGERRKAKKYLNMIQDPVMRRCTAQQDLIEKVTT